MAFNQFQSKDEQDIYLQALMIMADIKQRQQCGEKATKPKSNTF
jgi:hypothetical protein